MSFLTNKVVLVTGGASGIGLSIVENLVRSGVKGVGIVDINEENGNSVVKDLQNTFGDKILFIKADVTVPEEFEDAFEKIIDKFKNLDIVVNNAGIANEIQWEKTIAVNLAAVMRGTFLAVDKYLPSFKSGQEGVVVNIASVLGIDTILSAPAYCAAKHGVVALGKCLGCQEFYTKNKIRIITICPGVVVTPLIVNDTLMAKDPVALRDEVMNLSRKASSPQYVAESTIELINNGSHGSIWVPENEEPPYEVLFPHRDALRKTINFEL